MNRLIDLIFFILLLIPYFLLGLKDIIFFLDCYSFSIFIIWFYLTIRNPNNRSLLLIASYMCFAIISTLAISLFVENGVYLGEINRYSFRSGTTVIATLQCFIVIHALKIGYKLLSEKCVKIKYFEWHSEKLFEITLYLLCIIGIIILTLIALNYGTPKTYGLHRQDYWTYIAPSWGNTIIFWLIQFCFVLGYFQAKSYSILNLVLYISIVIIVLLFGERFTGIILMIIFFYIPIIIIRKQRIISFKSILIITTIMLFLIIFMISFESFGTDNISDIFIIRGTLQSQMWWALNEVSSVYPKSFDEIKHYFGIGLSINDRGVYYLMYQVAPDHIVEDRIATDSRFTASGIMNNIYYFGYFFGSILNYIWGLFLGLICKLLYISILKYKNILFIFICFKLLIKIQTIMLAGSTPDLFSFQTFIFIFICLLFLSFKKNNQTRDLAYINNHRNT